MGYPIGVAIGAPLRKYRPEQITGKELSNKIRSWKRKELSRINVPKTANFVK